MKASYLHFSLICFASISACEPEALRGRPTDEGSEVPDFQAESSERVEPNQHAEISVANSKLTLPENSIKQAAMIRLKKLTKIPDREALAEIGAPISDIIEVNVFDENNDQFLPSTIFKENYEFSQITKPFDASEKINYIAVSSPNTENEEIFRISGKNISVSQAGLVSVPLEIIIESKLTNVILWAVEQGDQNSIIILDSFSGIQNNGGSSATVEEAEAIPPDETSLSWVKVLGSSKVESLNTIGINSIGKVIIAIGYTEEVFDETNNSIVDFNALEDASIIQFNELGEKDWIRSVNTPTIDRFQSFIHSSDQIFVNSYTPTGQFIEFASGSFKIESHRMSIWHPKLESVKLVMKNQSTPLDTQVFSAIGFSSEGGGFINSRRAYGGYHKPQGYTVNSDWLVEGSGTNNERESPVNPRGIPVYLKSGKVAFPKTSFLGSEVYYGPSIVVVDPQVLNGNLHTEFAKGFAKQSTMANISLDSSDNVYWAGAFSGIQSMDLVGDTDQRTAPTDFLPIEFRDLKDRHIDSPATKRWAFLSKYANSFPDANSYRWTKVFESPTMSEINSIKARGKYIYVTGSFIDTLTIPASPEPLTFTSKGGVDSFVAKFTADGAVVWAHSFGGEGNEMATRIDVGNLSQIVVGGLFSGASSLNIDNETSYNFQSRGEVDLFIMQFQD